MVDRRLLVLALGTFAIGTDSFVVAGILPLVAHSMNVRVAIAGQMVTLYAISYALLSPVVATLFAHWPRKKLLLSGMVVFVIANVLTALSPTLPLLFVSRLLAGLGAAMFSPTATATGASIVAPEQRGRALAIVIAGLSSATALGAPLGTVIGGLGDWRATMWFVAALGTASGLGVWALLPYVSAPPAVSLRERLAPLADARVAWTLVTTLFAYTGAFTVYTYIGVTLDRVTHGDGNMLAVLLVVWGIAATAGNMLSGRFTDAFGNRRVINTVLAVGVINFALLPLTSVHMATTIVALIIWGVCGWGLLVPQQHRLLHIFPSMGALLMSLNSAGIYLGVSASGVLGGFAITYLDKYHLGLLAACFMGVSLLFSQVADRLIARRAATRAGAERGHALRESGTA